MLTNTEVLFVGIPWPAGRTARMATIAHLRERRSETRFMSDTEPTFAAAQGVVLELPKLKIVHISNTASNLPGEKLNQHCERLAEQLSEHLGKPWVVLADEALFDDAATLFEKRGVRVERGELTDAIEDRWAHDAKLQEAAVA